MVGENPPMARGRIIVIEDEPDILEVIRYNLVREGFKVDAVRDGEAGLAAVRAAAPDLVLLDLMLPGLDGLEICRRLKEDPLTRPMPIVMVTAKDAEADIVLGLGVGADDYVTKPFSPRELLARVNAVLRRGPLRDAAGGGERIVREGVMVDLSRHELLVDGRAAQPTATELRLLHVLASHPGRVFTRDQLLTRVIGQSATVVDRNIDVHVLAIRKMLGPYRDLVETIRGVGYRFRDADA